MATTVLATWCVAALLAAPIQEAPPSPKSTRAILAEGEARDEHGRTGLVRAGLAGDRALFQRILQLDRLRLQAAIARAAQPLSESGMALVRALHARRRLIDEPGDDGVTPLMLAAQRGWEHLVSWLLEAGARPSPADRNGLTAADHAERSGFASLAKDLRSATDRTPK